MVAMSRQRVPTLAATRNAQVRAALRTAFPETTSHRNVSLTVMAVAYLRARAAGRDYYSERDHTNQPLAAGDVRPVGQFLATWSIHLEEYVPADSVTDQEATQAQMMIALADNLEDATGHPQAERRYSRATAALARALYHHGDVVDAATA
jgi:hypothetical protein